MLRILHSADWQLGKPYARVADSDKRARLRQERLEAIGRLGALARERQAACILVAGDLFDAPQPSRAQVSAACSAIGAIDRPVLAIPGNHDHGGPGSLWQERYFLEEREQLAPNLHVLLEREPVDLRRYGLPPGLLLPCPLLRRSEPGDPTAWLRSLHWNALPGGPRIVLAHGSIQEFGGGSGPADADDENPPLSGNRIDLAALPASELDYIALGDWHGLKQVAPRAWYSGCHEMDRFPRAADYRSGQALLVTLERGGPPEVEVLPTGAIGWHQIAHRFSDDADLERLEQRVADAIGSRSNRDLLLLELDGSLSLAAAAALKELLQRLEARLLRLKLRDRTSVAPDPAELRQLTERAGDPLVARVARRLQQLQEDAEQGELARLALRELHRSCTSC
ncbi:DNA repair exonuclease [Synechococcus sp. RSCCF101]|uniref:metallophosphoesterase family protein n=1 Tax=Synechococcus sp. RSCCF101 TaxID=2511069 RepID=UPI001244CA64|nr:metallophosphoesterase [Synechococcus sp. RSCCF101]QEY32754.1 DNA repair exonuclease [Synechococcus sp. RSCCF101]